MKKIFYKLADGRPMDKIRFEFNDVVSGEKVYSFIDKFDRKWLATNKWSLFRVKKNNNDKH